MQSTSPQTAEAYFVKSLRTHKLLSETLLLAVKTQHDFKSMALNFASCLLLLLPFGAYLYNEHFVYMTGAVILSFAVALLAHPVGWMRPHPYSDIPTNKPRKSV
jgi:hypothetical protein